MNSDSKSSPFSELPHRSGLSLFDYVAIALAGGAGLLLLILAVLFSGIITSGGILSVAAPMVAGIVSVIALVRPRWIFYGYISLCMIMPHELEEIFLPLGFMRLYPQDVLFAFLILLTLIRIASGRATLHQISFNRQMFLYLALGIWAAAVGLFITGNEYDNVFGDFRRSFFYFLAYFFALLLTGTPNEIRYLKYALLAGAAGVIFRGFFQVATGGFVTRRIGDAAHIMNHFEVTFSTLGIFYGLSKLSVGTRRPWIWISFALAGLLIVVLGNFRTCWIGLLGGLSALILLLPPRQRRRVTLAAAISFAFGAVLLSMLWDVPVEATKSTIGENIASKADLSAAASDTNVGWRIDSYRNALQVWQSQPLIGRGLGEELEFYTATSTGHSMLAIGHRVHNSYLWFLMSLGLIGFALLVYVHGRYILIIWKALSDPKLSAQARITLTGLTAFYVTILICALFDVYLESSPPITVISVTMAICLLTIRYELKPKISDHEVQV